MSDYLDYLRYEWPMLYRSALASILVMTLMVLFLSLPSTPLLRAIGISTAQTKVTALYYALYWQARAYTGTSSTEEKVATIYGNMQGLDESGEVIVSIPSGDKFIQTKFHLADIKLTDLYGTAVMIGQLRTEDARFEIYSNNQVVVWIRNVPFNVKVIEAGNAIPDPNPPTNIVDIAFSTYYWRLFKGEHIEH